MKKLIECVKEALSEQKIPHDSNDFCADFVCEVEKWTISMRIASNDELGVLAFMARFPHCVPKDKYSEIYPLLNQGNNRGGFSRICMDEDTGTIRSTIFAYVEACNCSSEQIMNYAYLVVLEVAECYKKILKAIYC